MKNVQRAKSIQSLVARYSEQHLTTKDGFGVSASQAYAHFREWSGGACSVTYNEYVAATRDLGTPVRSHGSGPMLINQVWCEVTRESDRELKTYRVHTVRANRLFEHQQLVKQYRDQSELAAQLGLTSVQVGHLLDIAGLRDPSTLRPTRGALSAKEAILVRSYQTHSYYRWHPDVMQRLMRLHADQLLTTHRRVVSAAAGAS